MNGTSPNTFLSHYKIVSKLGAGGMAEVYLAQDMSELRRTVVLKVLSADVARDKDRLQRFTQEAFSKLNQSIDEHQQFIGFMRIDPFMKPLRGDPRYPEALKKVGFPQ